MTLTTGMEDLARQRWYARYRDKLDAREVLAHYGAQNISEQPGENGTTELVHSCLYERVEPHHNHGDANPSAALNVEKKKYVCYTGGWKGDLLHLIMKLENQESFSDALIAVSELFHEGPHEQGDFAAKLMEMMATSTTSLYSVDLPTYDATMLNSWRFTNPHPYLTERGITREAYHLLQLGYDEREVRVVFPHFFDGNLVGFQKRVVPPRPGQWPGTVPDFPKYRSSSGFPKAESLYGYDLVRRPPATGVSEPPSRAEFPGVIVVESPFSVAKAHALGIPNVVATFGAKVTRQQLLLLQNFPEVTVWFDDDTAGHLGERKIVEFLRVEKVRVVAPEPGRDLADCESADEVRERVEGAIPGFLRKATYTRPKGLR